MGNQLTCPEGICRRKGICFGMRDEERYSLAFLVFPPCVPLDLEIIETCRQEISTELKRVAAGEMRAAAGNCRRRGP